MDLPATQRQSPIRFYKLKNTTVDEVLDTLRSIEGIVPLPPAAARPPDAYDDANLAPQNRVEGAFHLPLRPGQEPPPLRLPGQTPIEEAARVPTAAPASAPSGIFPGGAQITADPNTNSLIVVAEPAVQKVYEELIRSLDHRRPQVLIQAKIVAVDTSDDYSLGIEVSGGDRLGAKKLLAFSYYGLSEVTSAGMPTLIPGIGFNGTLVDPEIAGAVVRALAVHTRARILASPRILVNDNSEGRLQSVLSVPFSSVNASQTVSTTSLGGNQDAGTTITVTPHISEGDHLQLEFSIEFSSFAGSSISETLPPPRQVDEVQSSVTIPDGHTVIVGGLNRHERTQGSRGFPLVEHIPILKYVGGLHSTTAKCTSLFVFIRPVILRDDKFRDLKFLSDRDAGRARICGPYPSSEPVLIE